MVVVVVVRIGRDDLDALVRATHRADPVGTTGAVALRARVEDRGSHLVLRAALRGAAVRLLLLRDGHNELGRVDESAPRWLLDFPGVSAAPIIRPIRDEDVPACAALAWEAISAYVPAEFLTADDDATRIHRSEARMRRFLALDPGGCWTAEVEGRPVATALALVREGIWGLSLFGVEPGLQGQGIGRRVLDAALAYGDGCRGAIIAATLDPRALRRYARAGFALHPSLAGCGIVDRHAAPDPASLRSRETTWTTRRSIAAARDVSRHVRGASHAEDLEGLAVSGGTPIVLDGEGWAVRDGDGSPTILAARHENAARDLLWACLLGGKPGATLHVDWLTGLQPWAVDVVLQAGLPLSADGAICVRGDVGPMTPYLPSGDVPVAAGLSARRARSCRSGRARAASPSAGRGRARAGGPARRC